MTQENIENKEQDIDTQIEQTKIKARVWVAVGAFFFCFSIVLVFSIYKFVAGNPKENKIAAVINQISNDQSNKTEEKPQVKLVRRAIDGVYVEEGQENIYPVAVMIENHVDSRPPSSLSEANLVYEAEAEGGITRFLAVYASGKDLDEIGPVRSARPYYVDWAEELNAVYAHCGGSPDALVKIKQDDVIDLNEFYNAARFWRGKDRSAPHNVYTSSEKLNEFITTKGLSDPDYKPWTFKDDEPENNRPEAQEIKISFRSFDFSVDWKYEKASNTYTRYLAGKPHADKSGQVITAKNVVIQYADSVVLDEKARLQVDVVGTGKTLVCNDGVCREGKWKKTSDAARTIFSVNKNEIASSTAKSVNSSAVLEEAEFNGGTTWIEVVKPSYKVEF